jgi:D-alanyl-D-alanine carboxypeptidase
MKVKTKISGSAATNPQRIARKAVMASICCVLSIVGTAPVKANYAALIMDATTGRVLHEANADLTRYPASLTKMMTLYLLFEALENGALRLDDRVPISEHAASRPPTKLGLRPGQSISVEDAILAMITKSANDVAAAVAEHLGGSESRFAWTMTERAHQLGMSRTNFVNASGLPDPDQVTTARDMAILGLALVHHFPQYYPYFSTDEFYYGGAMHANHNRLLGSYYGLDGIKTGYTAASGYNLVASAVREGRRLIGVVLGARSLVNRSVIMTGLLDQAFGGGQIIEVQEDTTVPATDIRVAGLEPSQAEAEAAAPGLGATPSASARTVRESQKAIGTSNRSRAAARSTIRTRAAIIVAHASEKLVRGRNKVASSTAKSARVTASASRPQVKVVRVATNDRALHIKVLSGAERKSAITSAPKAQRAVAVAATRPAAPSVRNKAELRTTVPSPRPAGRDVKASNAREKARLRVSDDRRRSS